MSRKARQPTKAEVKAAADRAEGKKPEPKAPPAEPRREGRPSKYQDAFAEQAVKLCQLGATDAELANFFEVNTTTIWRWQSVHPEFCNALKRGKEAADERVERSLYAKATGYTHDAVKIFMPSGSTEPVYAKYQEHVAPDTTACIFWLKNRRSADWRDRQELSGPGGGPIQTEDLSGLTDTQRARRIAFTLAKAERAAEK